MKNFLLSFSDVSGGGYVYNKGTGKEIIRELLGDDIKPPLTSMHITAKTKDGKTINIYVPNDDSEEAFIEIE